MGCMLFDELIDFAAKDINNSVAKPSSHGMMRVNWASGVCSKSQAPINPPMKEMKDTDTRRAATRMLSMSWRNTHSPRQIARQRGKRIGGIGADRRDTQP